MIRPAWLVLGTLLLGGGLLAGCSLDEIERRDAFQGCLVEQAPMGERLFPALQQVEKNLVATGALDAPSKAGYRELVRALFRAEGPAVDEGVTTDALCRDVTACRALVEPQAMAAYPTCYQRLEQRGLLRAPDVETPTAEEAPVDTTWIRQAEIWGTFLRTAQHRESTVQASLDAMGPSFFDSIRYRGHFAQYALYVVTERRGEQR